MQGRRPRWTGLRSRVILVHTSSVLKITRCKQRITLTRKRSCLGPPSRLTPSRLTPGRRSCAGGASVLIEHQGALVKPLREPVGVLAGVFWRLQHLPAIVVGTVAERPPVLDADAAFGGSRDASFHGQAMQAVPTGWIELLGARSQSRPIWSSSSAERTVEGSTCISLTGTRRGAFTSETNLGSSRMAFARPTRCRW